MEWVLMILVVGCTAGGISSNIDPGDCARHEVHIIMPSEEICHQVVNLNGGGECWAHFPFIKEQPIVPDEPDHIMPPDVKPMPNPPK